MVCDYEKKKIQLVFFCAQYLSTFFIMNVIFVYYIILINNTVKL